MPIDRKDMPPEVAADVSMFELGQESPGLPEPEVVELPDEDDFAQDIDIIDEDGGVSPSPLDASEDFYANLAEFLPEEDLDDISRRLNDEIESDIRSLGDWEEIYRDGMRLLGFDFRNREDEIFENSCVATHPLLAESVVKYQAKARSQLLPPQGPAKARIMGAWSPQKEQQSQRVKEYMNYQITWEMSEYDAEHDRMLFHQGFSGDAITKIYWDSILGRPVSKFIPTKNFIINYGATDLQSAYRYTEVVPNMDLNEFKRNQLMGLYRFVPEWDPENVEGQDSISPIDREEDKIRGIHTEGNPDGITVYEVHTFLALDGAVDDRTPEEQEIDYELPYIVTMEKTSGKILAIRRNWKPEDPTRAKRVWYVHWPFIPGFGFWGLGYIHLIGGLSKASTSILRQLIDAGSFATLPAGFKAKGFRVVGNNQPLRPGEWREINATSVDVDKVFKALPYKEPSQTLYTLLEFVVVAAQKFADSTEQVVSESTNYGPVGTTLALLDASGKLFTAIHERLFKAQQAELRILSELNAENMPDQYPYEVNGAPRESQVYRSDFDGRVDIIPITDPRAPTAAHRAARANARLAIAGQFPHLHNMREVLSDLHYSLDESSDPTRFLQPPPPEAVSADPLSENQLGLQGKPIKAAPYQDHVAHIRVHAALIQSQNPMLSDEVKSTMAAHIHQHFAEQFRSQVEEQLGQELPPLGTSMPPDVENEISRRTAEAVSQLEASAGIDFGVIGNSDPLIEIQKMEVEVDRMNAELKKYIADQDTAFKQKELEQEFKEHLDKMALEIKKLQQKQEEMEDDKEVEMKKIEASNSNE